MAEKRTALHAYYDLIGHGRNAQQIHSIAVAREDKELREYAEMALRGETLPPAPEPIVPVQADMSWWDAIDAKRVRDAEVAEAQVAEEAKAEKPVVPEEPKKPKAPRKEGPTAVAVAADVLRENGKPMTAAEIVAIMLESKRWSTNGKTPDRTLSVAIIRDIQKNGDKSAFRRADDKKFVIAPA
jgi:hypothetical protein